MRAGSEEAFAWLIARYHQPIFSLLARTVHDRADAADLTQEVFVKVFRGIGGFHGDSSLRTWIYRIALREASNQRRWWMRHKQQEVPIEQEIYDGDSRKRRCASERHAGRSRRIALRRWRCTRRTGRAWSRRCAKCRSRYRTTLILRDIEGFVYEEVAEMQGVNLGTVKSRLVRGRAWLKALLTAPCRRPARPPLRRVRACP